ncbi:MAG: hypothetical protein IPG46_03880 [Actinobacteria bacterium]|nr:hypothetical protein [Actinomycetota bacterium]
MEVRSAAVVETECAVSSPDPHAGAEAISTAAPASAATRRTVPFLLTRPMAAP